MKSLNADSEPQAQCCSQMTSPVEMLRNRSRCMKESAARLEKLADQFERLNWNQETTQAFLENYK